jgi:hypothetical protein
MVNVVAPSLHYCAEGTESDKHSSLLQAQDYFHLVKYRTQVDKLDPIRFSVSWGGTYSYTNGHLKLLRGPYGGLIRGPNLNFSQMETSNKKDYEIFGADLI